VWLDEDGKLKPVTITSGLDDGNNVEVLSGDLKPGDTVVTDVMHTASAAPGGGSPLRGAHF